MNAKAQAAQSPSNYAAAGQQSPTPQPLWGQVACATQRSHVDEETDATSILVNRLGNALRTLEEKLEKVTSSIAPYSQTPGTAGVAPAPYRVPLAEKIRVANNELETLIHGLEELLPRIEL